MRSAAATSLVPVYAACRSMLVMRFLERVCYGRQAGTISVLRKSSPLNSSGSFKVAARLGEAITEIEAGGMPAFPEADKSIQRAICLRATDVDRLQPKNVDEIICRSARSCVGRDTPSWLSRA